MRECQTIEVCPECGGEFDLSDESVISCEDCGQIIAVDVQEVDEEEDTNNEDDDLDDEDDEDDEDFEDDWL
ncbi:MAG: hypothetical protein ABIH21_03335 [Patescibacteria group bacterium]